MKHMLFWIPRIFHKFLRGLKSDHQTCKKCGRLQRFEFSVKDELWGCLDLKWQLKALCIECFLEELEDVAKKHTLGFALGPGDFNFLGVATPSGMLDCIILDKKKPKCEEFSDCDVSEKDIVFEIGKAREGQMFYFKTDPVSNTQHRVNLDDDEVLITVRLFPELEGYDDNLIYKPNTAILTFRRTYDKTENGATIFRCSKIFTQTRG